MEGVYNLRHAISDKISSLYGTTYDPKDEITITAGATQALFTIFSAFVTEGDEVIILEPAYDSYAPGIFVNGGIPVHIPLDPITFDYDWEWVKRSINQRTKMIVINSPHNPSGKMFTQKDLDQLNRLTKNNDIIIVSDEVYEHITFDGRKHLSLSAHAEMCNKTLVVSSFGKTYHTTGWKLGYVAGPAELMNEFRKVHQFNVFSCNTPMQYAYSEILKRDELFLELPEFYQQKRDYFVEAMKQTQFRLTPAEGTYFQLVNYEGLSDLGDVAFAEWLTKEIGVAAIPLSPFYQKNPNLKWIRFCFAKNNETIDKAVARLCKI
jgi:methionine aminotransferase